MNLDDLVDVELERQLLAVVIDSARGAALAVEHGISADVFGVDTFRRVAAVALHLDAAWPDRLDLIAHRARVARGWLDDVANAPRPVLHDRAGTIAARALAAADRRARAEAALAALAELGIEAA